ncbi:metallophosphoesterase [uncultured Muribaculum sp.]|jgi:lipoprotein|uniref:metallophosphoesterase n=1 Tax=uncultured Muribaculum sp. TaxID=1918613 RepID=UPI00259CC076|nr:metallophosphoesterase [uncultured Muribaculum sp.]
MIKYDLYIPLLILHIITLTSCNDNDDVYSVSIQDKDLNINPNNEYIVVLGDVQEYTASDKCMRPFMNTIEWTLSQSVFLKNIPCVIQVGDVTNTNSESSWYRYSKAMANLSQNGIPIFTCTGNHDYLWDHENKIFDRGNTLINRYCNPLMPNCNIVSYFEPNHIENIILKLPLRSLNIYLMILEFAPRHEVLKWAQNWIIDHPDEQFILLTHEFLDVNNGNIIYSNSYAQWHFETTNSTWSDPKTVSDVLLRDFDNCIAVICGHNGFVAFNDYELKSPIIMFNLQYQINGGDSLALLLELNPIEKSITPSIYHTNKREFVNNTPLSGKEIYLTKL